ncbi:MAG TPA: ester cyclase, partial [Thermomicrobiales bacterium]|nr:ester cyclase [Thermomicrobiales bacterium]
MDATVTGAPERLARVAAGWLAAWNAHDAEGVAALLAPGFEGIDIAFAAPQAGDQAREAIGGYLRAFPDLAIVAEETLVQGNRVVVTWTARGTHRGPWLHIPPTGRAVAVRGVTVLTVAGDRVTHSLCVWDVA